jgi:hypothetical protein
LNRVLEESRRSLHTQGGKKIYIYHTVSKSLESQ